MVVNVNETGPTTTTTTTTTKTTTTTTITTTTAMMMVTLQLVFSIGKGKVITINAMKACMGRRGTAPFILNLGTRWRQAVNFISHVRYAQDITSVSTAQKAGWTPKPLLGNLEKRKRDPWIVQPIA
jgi:hypothetical protein